MHHPTRHWQRLFLFCLGLFAASAFCMKWMEPAFIQDGKLFTIIGLEVSYSKEKVVTILSGIDDHVRTLLRYHLSFDFVFMAGVYPGIAALCMMARSKAGNNTLRLLLFALAVLQAVAWGCDIAENLFLLDWLKNPSAVGQFTLYHTIVWAKWVLALTGALLAIPLSLRKNKQLLKT